ncbi:MAG: hypothetical protein LBT53_04280 [Puniceicoccales bacterium]|jgi:hypothetical protein|nr:hypothetical protein [Puniceicoccales bacterium]
MPAQRIRILGTQSSGKTVLLAALTHRLSSTVVSPRITSENIATHRYTAGVMDALENGNWPPSTAVGLRQELRWLWHDADNDAHELLTFDCAGQDFRAIFEAEADTNNAQQPALHKSQDDDEADAQTDGDFGALQFVLRGIPAQRPISISNPVSISNNNGLNAQQLALREAFFSSDLVLLLFNFQEALDIYGKPGKNQARIEVEIAPAIAIRRLRAAGITVYIILTQADRYRERVEREWKGNYSEALHAVLPQLFLAALETGTPYAVVSAVETEERDGKILPKKIKVPRYFEWEHTGTGILSLAAWK